MNRSRGQLSLDLERRTWGGKRKGAGRKPGVRRSTPHRARPEHVERHPVHATLRVAKDVGNLRAKVRFKVVKGALRAGRERDGFRLVHFSVQGDHLHLMVEGADKVALSAGLRGLSIRVARALNKLLRRAGRVFSDRVHARALKTPREVRSCLSYLYNNARKHAAQRGRRLPKGFVDPLSSAAQFDGWKRGTHAPPRDDEPPITPAASWLAKKGWRRWGLISPDELPATG